MSLKIRMSRGGAKKRPFYSIVVADSRSPRDGRFLEKLGTYNPMLERDNTARIRLDEARVRHWLGLGALPSERVALFLSGAGIIEKPKQPVRPNKSAPKAKAQERAKANLAAEEAAKVAAAEAAAAPPPVVEEAPVTEDAPVEATPAAEAPAETEAAS